MTPIINPFDVLRELTPERIRKRLDELDRESKALRVLLRSSMVRQPEGRRQEQREVVNVK